MCVFVFTTSRSSTSKNVRYEFLLVRERPRNTRWPCERPLTGVEALCNIRGRKMDNRIPASSPYRRPHWFNKGRTIHRDHRPVLLIYMTHGSRRYMPRRAVDHHGGQRCRHAQNISAGIVWVTRSVARGCEAMRQ